MHLAILTAFTQDMNRQLESRVSSLLKKKGVVENAGIPCHLIVGVGDSTDGSEEYLRRFIGSLEHCIVINNDTPGDLHVRDMPTRLRRLSVAWNKILDAIPDGVSHCLIHESDLLSADNLALDMIRLHIEHGRCPIAGWPVIDLGKGDQFYDTWAYRGVDGGSVKAHPPHHRDYSADEPFEVSSVGSVWAFHAEDVTGEQGIRMDNLACKDLCAGMVRRGRRLWVDPKMLIRQPKNLWTFNSL